MWQDLADAPVSPQNVCMLLAFTGDAARSRPSRPKKKFVSIPPCTQCLPMHFFSAYYLFCGVGCLSQGKEGQREVIESKKRVPTRRIPGVVIPSRHSRTFVIHLKYDTVALKSNGHLCRNLKQGNFECFIPKNYYGPTLPTI